MTVGLLASGAVRGFAGTVTTAPLTQLPLVLIPAYFVQLFFMMHITALFQARQRAVSQAFRRSDAGAQRA